MKMFDIIVYAILIIGALNWGLVGLFDINAVDAIFGEMTAASRLIYIIVGLAALYDLILLKAIWKRWDVHFRKPLHA